MHEMKPNIKHNRHNKGHNKEHNKDINIKKIRNSQNPKLFKENYKSKIVYSCEIPQDLLIDELLFTIVSTVEKNSIFTIAVTGSDY